MGGMGQAKRHRHLPGRPGQVQGSTDELTAIFAAMADAVVVYDANGRIVQMNETANTLFQVERRRAFLALPLDERSAGLEMQDLEGHPLLREQWPATRVLHGERLTGVAAPDIRARTPDGHDLILNISGAPLHDSSGKLVGAVCIARDVTERWRLERELAERASQIEGIFESLTDSVVLCDPDGRIVRMNAAHRLLLGYDATREVAASRLEEYAARYTPRDSENRPLPKEDWPIHRILRGETLTGARVVEMRIRTLDGRELIVQVSGAPVRDAAGHIIGAVSATRDITVSRQLEQQQRDILRVVAHDLMNPITGVRLYLQTQERRLRKGQPPFVPDDTLLGTLNANLTRMERLVNDLQAVTSIEAGALSLDRRPCDLTALCRQEVEVQHLLAPARVIQVEAPQEPLHADVDAQRVGQVVANFLSNALKYSPADCPVTLALRADDATVRIAVHDAGPGIPEAELAHLWERFHRVEGIKAQDGTQSLGLGLYICRAIIERHGGRVGVESTLGVGSTFWCTLPLAPSETNGMQVE